MSKTVRTRVSGTQVSAIHRSRAQRLSLVRAGIALTAAVGLAFAGIGVAQAAVVADVIDLGAASTYAVLAGEGATNTADNGIEGDVGVSPGASTTITGFDSDQIRSTEDAANAQEALTSAYNEAAAASPEVLDDVELGGQTLPAGAYSGGALGLTGTLTLNAANDPNAIWVFQAASTLTTAGASSIEFVDGIGSACNVFWQIGSSAFLGDGDFVGTVMAQTSISSTGATVEGRLLARGGAVTLTGTSITVPDGCDEQTGPGGSGPSEDDQREADEAADDARDSADRAADAADEAAEGADELDSDEADEAADRAADAAEAAADAADAAAEAADRGDKDDARDAADRADEAADEAEAAAQDVQDLVDAANDNGGGGTGNGGGTGGSGNGGGTGGSGNGGGTGGNGGSTGGNGNGGSTGGSGNGGSTGGSGNGGSTGGSGTGGNGNGGSTGGSGNGGTGTGTGTGTGGSGVDQKPVVVAGVPVTSSPVKTAPVLPNTGSNPDLAGGIAGLLLLLGFGAIAIATKRRNRVRARP